MNTKDSDDIDEIDAGWEVVSTTPDVPEPTLALDTAPPRSALSLANRRATQSTHPESSLQRDEPVAAEEPAQPNLSSTGGLNTISSRFRVGDYSGALIMAERLLDGDPEHASARSYANKCREMLFQMCSARIGSFDQKPQVSVRDEDMRWLSLDHRSGFVLSFLDGTLTVEDVLDVCGMTRLEAMRILCTLLEQGVIELEPPG